MEICCFTIFTRCSRNALLTFYLYPCVLRWIGKISFFRKPVRSDSEIIFSVSIGRNSRSIFIICKGCPCIKITILSDLLVISSSGISFKIPFIESTQSLPKETLLYDLAASDVITKDKKTMISDSYVLWKISDPLKFAQTLNSSVENGESRINTAVYNATKNTLPDAMIRRPKKCPMK